MALSTEIYAALEAIVGKRGTSPRTRACWRPTAASPPSLRPTTAPTTTRRPCPRPSCCPAAPSEVQKIVRICNKYGIKFKASTTFWSAMGYIDSDYAIQLDMRRMRSIEIDERNMCAIIEPYAIGAVVQAEAMKVGLTMNVPGVGCSSSPLASTAGWVGFGPTSISMGCASENMLGAEWVLPDGEVVRTGSLGAGSGWFCGEGPGPSTRGILRGFQGSTGSLGVCTRMAIRLHPWPGPTYIPSRGMTPAYKADLPDNFKAYTLCFQTWDDYAKGIALIARERHPLPRPPAIQHVRPRPQDRDAQDPHRPRRAALRHSRPRRRPRAEEGQRRHEDRHPGHPRRRYEAGHRVQGQGPGQGPGALRRLEDPDSCWTRRWSTTSSCT